MIIQIVIDLFMLPLNILIDMLPVALLEKIPTFQLPDIARMGAYFFPLDVMSLAVGMFGTWYAIHFTWAIIEWIYKKIPGIS